MARAGALRVAVLTLAPALCPSTPVAASVGFGLGSWSASLSAVAAISGYGVSTESAAPG